MELENKFVINCVLILQIVQPDQKTNGVDDFVEE